MTERARGGGVLILVKSEYFSEDRKELVAPNNAANEILAVEIKNNHNQRLLVIGVYRPDSDSLRLFIPNMDFTLCSAYQAGFKDIAITGDFNTRNIHWDEIRDKNLGGLDLQFCVLLDKYGLTQHVKEPTTKSGFIDDLFITNFPDKVSRLVIRGYDYDTDHFTIEAFIDWTKNKLIIPTRKVYDISKANFNELKDLLTSLDHTYLADEALTIDTKWETWFKKIMDSINLHVPQKKIGKNNTPPWIDLECIKLIQKKNRTLSKAKKSGNPETDNIFRQLRNRIKNLITRKANLYINNLCENLTTNPKKFWTYLKNKTKKNTLPQILRNALGVEATSDLDKATMFNDYFYSTFNFEKDLPLPVIEWDQDPELSHLIITSPEVSDQLKGLNTSKAIGPDGIPSAVLKECHTELADSLTELYNLSLTLGKVPKAWKCANVVPIFKKGNSNIVKNYRPVSLLPVISKVLEKLIHNTIIQNLIPKITLKQHGFMPTRSTVTQLLATFLEVNTNLDTGRRTDIIYFDLAKAFDSVPHKLLIHKLKKFGFNGSLLLWMTDYLQDRNQRVIVNGTHSNWKKVQSGVPQGATLGPLKFLLYVNDLPDVLSKGTQCGIFADDTKILRPITTNQDIHLLQQDIDSLFDWSKLWGLQFNIDKCMVLSAVRSHNKINDDLNLPHYTMNNKRLVLTTEIQDLGIKIDSKLTWANHINAMVRKAHSRSWLCMRALGFHAFQKAKRTCYMTMVRSILEYGAPIWSPTFKYLIVAIENIQRRATNYILKNPKRPNPLHSDYKKRLIELNLLPLTYRREIIDIQTFLKTWNNTNKLGLNNILDFTKPNQGPVTRAMAGGLTLRCKQTRLISTAHFYPYRLTLIWNKLPYDTRLKLRYLTDPQKIKRIIKPHYINRLKEHFDPENTCTWVTHCDCYRCRPM